MEIEVKNNLEQNKILVENFPVPNLRVVEFQLLQDCNLNCIYCAYDQAHSKTAEEMSLKLVERVLFEDLASNPPQWVWFEGGEVTMNSRSQSLLLEALSITKRAGVTSRINTNAQKCNPEFSHQMADLGLSFACVSCDSVDPDLFCRMRGMNQQDRHTSFKEFKQNVKGLIEAGIIVDLEVTLTRLNIDQLEAVYDFAESFESDQVLMGVQFLVATSDQIFDLYPDFNAQYAALKNLIRKAEKGNTPLRICCCPLNPCHYPDLYEPNDKVIWVGCSCGYDYVHIHATGDVFLCGFWDHSEPIGNLNNASLPQIWHESAMRRDSQSIVPEGCSGCGHFDGELRCHNTCFSVVYRKTKDFSRDAYAFTTAKLKAVR
jgi:MoaA/NifB/PqqE/SkfB family radical SAM enzyme